jgi:serine/threonine-protein kinase
MPHDIQQAFCPATGRAIDRTRQRPSERMPAAAHIPSSPPPSTHQHQQQPQRPPEAPSRPPPAPPPTMPPARSAQRDLTGKKIGGKYVVRAVLGEGGMGTVFEAEHITIGRSVAVKVLHPQQARKKDAVKRFHQEARAAGAIGHPNICEVYDLGTLDDGSPYLVMERLMGETLADRIASEGGLPFDDVIDVLTQVLSGLVAAHEKRIVHRDIKPENVFLTKRVGCPPVAKLLDFGVSKMMPVVGGEREDDLDLTRTGMVMGTPYYMSPEQARGDRNLDARVDLYACGVIMYEALTGRRPYTAANYNALLLQILTTRPRPARELRPALPSGFDAVLDKSMARAREDRYQSAAEFQRDLQTLRDRHQPASPPIPLAIADLARNAFTPKSKAPAAMAPPSRVISATPPHMTDTERPPPVGAKPPAVVPRPRDSRPQTRGLPDMKRTETEVDPKPPAMPHDDPAPSSSSVEIPITFAADTPLSGENMPIEPTQMNARDLHRPATAEDFEDIPTEVRASVLSRNDDDHTTQKRGAELGPLLANVIVDNEGATEIYVARGGARPHSLLTPAPPAVRTSPTEEVDTLVKPNTFKRRPRPRTASSPDDTIKMGDELEERLQEARDRIGDGSVPDVNKPRVPKR